MKGCKGELANGGTVAGPAREHAPRVDVEGEDEEQDNCEGNHGYVEYFFVFVAGVV